MKFYPYKNAVIERDKLNTFILLVDNYNVETFENWVIKQYAITGSINGIIKNLPSCPFSTKHIVNNREYIKSIILNTSKDKLHNLVQKQYNLKASYRKNKQ